MREFSRPSAVSVSHWNLAQIELREGNFGAALHHRETADRVRATLGSMDEDDDIRHLFDLTHAAGTRDLAGFDQVWTSLEAGWPKGWRLADDFPWLLETAATYADQAGWTDRARRLRALAADLWRRLGPPARRN